MWSFGALLYEIWSLGHKPFEDTDNQEVRDPADQFMCDELECSCKLLMCNFLTNVCRLLNWFKLVTVWLHLLAVLAWCTL